MEGIYKHYIIDMSCNNNFVQVPTVQGDGNNVRGFEVELIANNVQYVVDASTTHVCIAGTKPDTKQILNDCKITSDGYILVDITQQMSSVAGRGDYCISLMDNVTNSLLTSFPFYILTTASAYNASEIISSNEFKTLTNGVVAVDKLKKDVEQLNEFINNSENIRNEKYEEAETNRNNLYDQAETVRNNTLKSTIDNEVQRVTDAINDMNEDYAQAELLRVNAENARKEAENVRQSNEENRQRDTATAISNAETATLNANNSAENANNQATYAQAQGNYAKEQGDYAKEQGNLANSASVNANTIADDLVSKRDSGFFKGEKGEPGKDGVVTTINGMFAFNIDSEGHLILTYASVDEQPNFSINEEGRLIYTFS